MTLRTDPEQRRAWERRSRERAAERARDKPRSPLPKGAAPARRTKIRERRPDRVAKRRDEEYGEHAELIRRMPCVACMAAGTPQTTPTVSAHVKTRGGGGKQQHQAPLCVLHEIEWHQTGRNTFDRKYKVRMRRVAVQLWRTSPYNPDRVQNDDESSY